MEEVEKNMRDFPPNPTRRYRRAIFLDRDGTINVDTHYPHKIEYLRLIPGALDALVCLAILPLDIIVVSNQAGIAQGRFTRAQMSQFNAELRSRIEHSGARIDAFYFCPHLELKHLSPDITPCECSKPSPGLLLEAARDFEIYLNRSFLIGDKISDIVAGETMGCITILLKTSKRREDKEVLLATPKHFADNLLEATLIVKHYLVDAEFV